MTKFLNFLKTAVKTGVTRFYLKSSQFYFKRVVKNVLRIFKLVYIKNKFKM